MDDKMTFDQLNADAKDKALQTFVPFYLALYRKDNLELIAKADDGEMADVNNYLFDNKSFSTDQLINGVIANRKDALEAILNTLDQTYDAEGNVNVAWNEWRANAIAKLNEGKNIPRGK